MTKTHTTAALTAKAIKKELKEKFPDVIFSVKSDTFSMGDSVNIRWIDMPIEKEVNEIVGKYQYGHFDGMIDMYENSNSRDDIPQVKFVSADRELSVEYKEKIKKIILEKFSITEDTCMEKMHCWFDELLWTEMKNNNY